MKRKTKEIIGLSIFTLVCVIIIGLVYNHFHKSYQEKFMSELEMQAFKQREAYCASTERLQKSTGIPKQYSCEQIKVMIEANFFPAYEETYECQRFPESEYLISRGFLDPNTKDGFVEYYILNCVEQKQ